MTRAVKTAMQIMETCLVIHTSTCTGLPIGTVGVFFRKLHVFNTPCKYLRQSTDMTSCMSTINTSNVLFLVYLWTFPLGVEPYVRSAHEGRFPYVWDTMSESHVSWMRGSLLQHLLGSAAMRMTDNRMRFIPAGWTVIAVDGVQTGYAECRPHQKSLCQVVGSELLPEMGVGVGSLIFPIAGVPVHVHGNTSHVCKNGIGRISAASDIGETRYDISVCDVVDGPIDVLFTHDRIYLTQVNVDTSLYVITGLFVVVIIVLITQNLAVDILTYSGTGEEAIPTGFCVFLALALTFCSCVLPGVLNGVGVGFFVPISTLLDWYFLYVIVFYMGVHCFLWFAGSLWANWRLVLNRVLFKAKPTVPIGQPVDSGMRVGQLHSVNLMVCSLLLAIFSTHGTVETVLTSPLLFVFMFRTIFKSYAVENSSTHQGMSESYTQVVFEPLLIALDIVVVGTIHVVGMMALAETTLHAHTGLVMMFFMAHTLAFESNRPRRRPLS